MSRLLRLPFSNYHLISKIDDDSWIIGGYASVDIVDKQGDKIPISTLEKAWKLFIEDMDYAHVNVLHSNIPVGKIILEYTDKEGKVWKSGVTDTGLFILVKLRKNLKKARETWELIKQGKLRGFSIAGEAILVEPTVKGDKEYDVIKELELHEISIVDNPANQLSLFDIIKAKSITDIEDLIRGETVKMTEEEIKERLLELYKEREELYAPKEESQVDSEERAKESLLLAEIRALEEALGRIYAVKRAVSKPFAGYKNMADCIKTVQSKKDWSREKAAAYCAAVHHRVTGKWPSEKSLDMEEFYSCGVDIEYDDSVEKISYEERQKLPDSKFAAVYTVNGKKVRKLPIDTPGRIRNAIAVLAGARGGVDLPPDVRSRAIRRACAAAKKAGIESAWCENRKKSLIELIGPRTDEERARAHFGISEEEWNKLSEEEKQKYIDKLPPRGSAKDREKILKYIANMPLLPEDIEAVEAELLLLRKMAGQPTFLTEHEVKGGVAPPALDKTPTKEKEEKNMSEKEKTLADVIEMIAEQSKRLEALEAKINAEGEKTKEDSAENNTPEGSSDSGEIEGSTQKQRGSQSEGSSLAPPSTPQGSTEESNKEVVSLSKEEIEALVEAKVQKMLEAKTGGNTENKKSKKVEKRDNSNDLLSMPLSELAKIPFSKIRKEVS